MPFIDLLSRSEFINTVLNIVDNKIDEKKGFSLAIDGEWGCGKTTILNILQERLKSKFLVVRYNCWDNDFYDDPLIPLLYEFAEALNKEYYVQSLDYEKKALKTAAISVKALVDLLIESNIGITIELVERALSKLGIPIIRTMVSAYRKIKAISTQKHIPNNRIKNKTPIEFLIKQVQDVLGPLTGFENRGIILIIDELDRCLPDYAIKVLERLHHVCYGTRIILITAMNKKELSGSIAKAFGKINSDSKDSFAEHYLQKFVDFTICLNNGMFTEPDISFLNGLEQQFVDDSVFDSTTFSDWCRYIFSGIPMRNIQQIIQKLRIIHPLVVKERPCQHGNYSKSLLLAEIIDSVTFFYLHSEFHAETIEYTGSNGYDSLSYIGFSQDNKHGESNFEKRLRFHTNDLPSNNFGSDKQKTDNPKSVLKYLYRNPEKNEWEFEDNIDLLIKDDEAGLFQFRELIHKIYGIKVFE